MRRKRYLFALTLATLAMGCSSFGEKGSGKVATESRNVSGFTTVELDGDGKLVLEQTGTESLTITADDNLMQYLTSEVQDGKLKLGTKRGVNVNPSGELIYKVTARKVDGIVAAGSGSVQAKGIMTESLKTTIAGSGDCTITGQADQHEILIAGSGKVDAPDLKSKNVTISIAGSGDAVLAASEKLEVSILGSGSVEYIGDPVVTTKANLGSGTVKKH
jgi:hypothetical protein